MDWNSDSDNDRAGKPAATGGIDEAMDWTSDDDLENVNWDSDDDDDDDPHPPIPKRRCPSDEAGPSRPSMITDFIDMGFAEELVERAIKETNGGDTDAILDRLVTYTANGKSVSEQDEPVIQSSSSSLNLDDDFSDMECFGEEEMGEDISERDKKLLTLVEMGYPVDAASKAIKIWGQEESIQVLMDSIEAARFAEESDDNQAVSPIPIVSESCIGNSHIGKKRHRYQEKRKGKRDCFLDWKEDDLTQMCKHPQPMIGYGLPGKIPTVQRKLPFERPYFYYENVALAPKGVWETISSHLYEIQPEFVDSKYFSACARKRGYIHNLPIENRFCCLPIPPKTIQEALPYTRTYWPSWDHRTQLNCLQTCRASSKLTGKIEKALANCDNPPIEIQKKVLEQLKKWNLVWIGTHRVAPLEADDIEMLLGFPHDHTRGGTRTDRFKALGNSFQVDTVAFHLSVLKDKFPNGINVLSLFTGIGGGEVALHRLGIHLKVVVSIEISETSRKIVKLWWENSKQTGTLVEVDDVTKVRKEKLKEWINQYGGFDLVIGGSPCNNLTGSNRHTRHGLEGEHSSLFYEYKRILECVRINMAKMR